MICTKMKVVTVKEIPPNTKLRKTYRYEVDGRPFGQKRKRFKHGDKKGAELYLDEITTNYEKIAESNRKLVTENLLTEATEASKLLKPFDKSILEAVQFYTEYLEKESQRDATPLCTIIGKFLDEKEKAGVAESTHYDLKCRLGVFEKGVGGDRALSSFTKSEITEWLMGLNLSPQSVKNYRTVLHNLFAYSIKLGIISDNPVRDALEVSIRTKKAVILSPPEVMQVLLACDEKTLPSVVLQVFCGVRSTEAFRLDWLDIDLEEKELEVTEENAKRGVHQRIIPIPDCAIIWLKPLAKARGSIAPFSNRNSYVKALSKVHVNAGWEKGTWASNALRKTFISCHYETHQSVDMTAKHAGTSPNIIHRHYRRLIKPRDAKKLWELTPDKEAEVIKLSKVA